MRSLGEVCRRGLENVLANWPLVLIRIVEGLATLLAVVMILVAAIAPITIAGLSGASMTEILESPQALEELMGRFSPLLILYLFVVITVAMVIAVLIHAWVQGGVVGCYVIGDRRAPETGWGREHFRAFTPELWWGEARRLGWRFFWIYNVIWGAFSLLLLAPLLVILVVMLLLRESPAAIVVGCAGIAGVTLVAILLGIATFIWSQLVLIECAAADLGVLQSIRRSREVLARKLLPVVMVGAIFFAISMAVGFVIAGIAFGIGAVGSVPGLDLAFLPIRILISLFNSLVSTILSCWLLAALVAVALSPDVRHAASTHG
ncbi:MAG TPA: hypothetical protein VMS56_08530 [Thermoanaerobaculia bacterium]|nr:hypothetical protein [Thermoanaerobaculia bacterium]